MERGLEANGDSRRRQAGRATSRPLAVVAIALTAAHAVVAVTLLILEGAGPSGGYAAMYVLPAALVAVGSWSRRQGVRFATGWVALLLAALYAGVVLGNWTAYSYERAVVSLAVNVPTALIDLIVFSALVVARRPRVAGGQ